MKLIRYGIILVFLLVVSLQGFSQVTIWLEDFSYPNGTIQGSGTPPKWTRDISACTLTPPNNDYFEVRSNRMEGRDLDGEAVWTSETIDISSYTDVSISTDVSEGGTMEPDDYIRFYYKLDGGAETLFAVNGDISNDFPPLVASQSGLNANSLVIVVRVYNNGGGERHRFDNMLVFTYVDGDNCADAIAINEVTDLSFNTTNATASGVNPGCGGTTNPVDIWYAYTATATGSGSFDLCGSAFNTRLAIYGACGGMLLACNGGNGPACTGTNASIEISVTNGVTYYVQVSGNGAATGTGDLTISVTPSTNMDDCNNAYAINEVTDFAFTTVGATAGGDNPGCGGTTNPVDIWYAYTATVTGTGFFDLCGSSYDARLAIWDACSGNVLACNDDDDYCGSGSLQSFISMQVTSSTTYYIQVGGYEDNTGAGDLTISVTPPPANDDCSNAVAINEVNNLSFSTIGASASGINPGCGGTTNPVDIWYAFTATVNGTGSFDLCGSTFNTRLAIYDACGGTVLACNDDDGPACTGTNASIEISVTSGVTYYVQVSGNEAVTGSGDLTISVNATTNMDDCGNAYAINEVTDFAFTTVGATAGGDNPGCGGGVNPIDIWYAYTATETGTGSFDLCGSSYDTRLAIWDVCSGNVLACNDDDNYCGSGSLQSFLSFAVTSGTTYYIQVGGYNARAGAGDLTISVVQSATNDDCSNAIAVTMVNDLPFTTVGATAGGDNPGCGGATDPIDIWYAFTAFISGTANFDLCGSGYDTRLAVWDACNGNVLACNDDNGPTCSGLSSSIEMTVSAGTAYYVQVGGYNALTGTGDLSIYMLSGTAGFWTGTIDSDWDTGGNWFDGNVPGASIDVQIYSGAPNYPEVDETASCNNIILGDGGSLTINSGANLTVSGDVTGDGSLIVNDGVCAISGDLNNSATALVDVNGGTLSMDGWYEAGYFSWARGVVKLSGGTINVATHVAMNNANGTSVMNGPFNLNIGGTLQMQSLSFSEITGGTITLIGSGYVLPPFGTETFAAYNLMVNATGTYVFARDALFNQDSIVNNFDILAGTVQFHSDDGTGMPVDFVVGNNLTIAAGAVLDTDVSSSMTIKGDFNNDGTATFDNNTYEVRGNVGLGSGGVLNAGTGTLTIEGNWANIGAFNHNSGTVRFNGSTTISGTSTTSFGDVLVETAKELTGPSSATINIARDFTNNGTFNHNNGTIAFNGTTQTIGGAAQNLFNDLTIATGSSTTLNTSGQTLRGVLLSNGTFNTGGYLTLISDAAQTALIDGTGTGDVNGAITMQRYLPSGFGYKYYSSPCTAATVGEFSDDMDLSASFPTFYRYDENRTSAGWVDYTDPAGALVPLIGYAVNFGSSLTALTTDISGTVNNGTISAIDLYNHNNTYTKGFNLIGNPYPSPIDWDAATGWTRTNIDDALYYFDAGSTDQYVGTYSTYINGVSSDGVADNIIASMQGVFIHVSDGAYPVVGIFGMNNSVRVNNLSPVFHKSTQTDDRPLLRVSAGYSDRPEYTDQVAIYFDELSSPNFEKKYDALKLMNTDLRAPNVYAISSDQSNVSIQAMPFSADSITIVPLGVNTTKQGWVTIKGEDIDNMPMDMNVYLRDIETGLYHQLYEDVEYGFFLGANKFESRFSLVFAQKDIRHQVNGDDLYYLYSFQGILFVGIKTPSDCGSLVSVTNLAGRLLRQYKVVGNGYHQFNPNLDHGIYIVTIQSQHGTKSYKLYFS